MRVGIETDRGPWVAALDAAGYVVYPVNPLQAARYRQRHAVSGAKSDAADAHSLADMVRTDAHQLRTMAGDSPDAEAVKVVARAHKTLIWERTRQTQRLRHALREYFPAALEAFDDLDAADTLELLGKAPGPTAAARLSRAQISAALRRARRRDIDTKTTLNEQIAALEAQVDDHFRRHPDAEIVLSQPGLATVLGARVLAEFGDDPTRYATAKNRKNYAGTSPITRASGKRKLVAARYVHNDRLVDALMRQAQSALQTSPGARAYYDRQRARGLDHNPALRQLANRLVGILHGCLKTRTHYDETTAWSHHVDKPAA